MASRRVAAHMRGAYYFHYRLSISIICSVDFPGPDDYSLG